MASGRSLAVVGGGRMGEAIIGGLLAAGSFDARSIVVAEPDAARRAALAVHGVRCVTEGREAVVDAATVLLAVKPQVLAAVVASLVDALSADAVIVSIAAGISTARLEVMLPAGAAVVRVMPNTPALVGEGMAVVSGGSAATPVQVEYVRAMFAAVGKAIVIDERHQDAATAISGSGPAYVAILVDALAQAGADHGLPRDVAQALAVQTLKGTAELLESTGQTPEELVTAVASPGGTTMAAMARLEAGGFRQSVEAAVEAAVERAKELGAS